MRTRAALIEAAMRVFARLGLDAPTFDDFANEAGVVRGTFYNYFETREDVWIAVATSISERLLAEMIHLRALPDPADRMACSIRSFIRLAATEATWGWVIVKTALVAAPLGQRMRDYLAADIDEGLATGRFRAPSAQAAADLALGFGLMGMRSVLRGEAGSGHAEHVAEMVLRALSVDDAADIARQPIDMQAIVRRGAHGGAAPA